MSYYTGAVAVAKTLLLVLGAVVLLNGAFASAQGGDSTIEVMVCPGADESSFAVTEPQSDSLTNQPKLALKGSVAYISQIDFFLDDTYNHTLALGVTDTSFESAMTLPPGTHTVKFVATDSCSNAVYTSSIVITYEPVIEPSVGEEVETVVGDQTSPAAVVTQERERTPFERILDKVIIGPLAVVGEALDITNSQSADLADASLGNVRSLVFASGATLTLTALALQAGALAMIPLKFPYLIRHRYGFAIMSAVSGVLMMAVVFMV